MNNKIIEFLSAGLIAPVIYFLFALSVILTTFLIGLPIGIGIYLIDMAIKNIFGVIQYANL
jgi:hypothetical protein